jgi:hypothetical protein
MGVGVIGAACRFAKSGRIENRPQPIEAACGREILDPREVMEARAQGNVNCSVSAGRGC